MLLFYNESRVKYSEMVISFGEVDRVFKRLKEDIKAIREQDPAAKNMWEILICYPGLHSMILHRFAHGFYRRGMPIIARLISQFSRFITGIEIHPGAKIGKGLFIDHGSGVVIGETTEIGDYVTIYQGVTLGGTGKEEGKRHPTIGNNVLISAGAKILGSITIGNNVKVGAGSVVLNPVPDNCTVVGIPGKIIIQDGTKIPRNDLDQYFSDPMVEVIKDLQLRIKQLEKQLTVKQDSVKTEDQQVLSR